MNRRTRKLVRVLAIVLAVLLVGGTVTSVLVSAFGEEAEPQRDRFELTAEYMEDEQALRVSQRLVYHNRASFALDRVEFYASANMYRRQSALCYEAEVLEAVFPEGFAPAGMDGLSVRVDGETALWGMSGENETTLVVYAEVPVGGQCVFDMEYVVLLTENRAFLGQDELDVRLSAFYLIPGIPDETYHDWQIDSPLQHTRWVYTSAADYDVTLVLPPNWTAAGTGVRSREGDTWHLRAENVREFACAFSKRWRESTVETEHGLTIRVLANDRSGQRELLSAARFAADTLEEWFGAFPVPELTLLQTDHAAGTLSFPGLIWIPTDEMDDGAALRRDTGIGMARQYLGWAAYPEPLTDAWLSDTLCEYVALLLTEEREGENAFLRALNAQVLEAINQTVPGGLTITSDARLFTAGEYELITLDRGCVVMHELRLTMGREAFLKGLRLFYEQREKGVLGEMDLLSALNEAHGRDLEALLTDWLFNVDEYVQQQVDWYE